MVKGWQKDGKRMVKGWQKDRKRMAKVWQKDVKIIELVLLLSFCHPFADRLLSFCDPVLLLHPFVILSGISPLIKEPLETARSETFD